jgi:Cu/Ag efflux pump CusA
MAQVLVQNRVDTAVPQLPLDVQKQGAVTKKVSTASRQALGTAVIGGILASTLIAILFVPVYYVLMVRLSRWAGRRKKNENTAEQQLTN